MGSLGHSDLSELAGLLRALGCPGEKAAEMARQLDRRAGQLAEARGRTHEEALVHLLGLMRQGWAAQGGLPGGQDQEGSRPEGKDG